MFKNFYKNKKILITGHTGFKGSWLTFWLLTLGAKVIGVSVNIPTKPSNYKVLNLSKLIKEYFLDISDKKLLENVINKEKPDVIFHLAAQSLVINSINDPLTNFRTNILGSLNLLDITKSLKRKTTIIFITSDKVYENQEIKRGYKEDDKLGGKDPYSLSKSIAETIIKNYFNLFLKDKKNIFIAICRAGNVIGGGDWAKNRIIPDYFKSLKKKLTLNIRNPYSTRPWQHVFEPLSGYLLLGSLLEKNKKLNGEAFNFGPKSSNNFSVQDLLLELEKYKYKTRYQYKVKYKNIESILLQLNCKKALKYMSWKPVLNFKETIFFTYSWYENFYFLKKISMIEFSKQQLLHYQILAKKRKLKWLN